MENKFTKYTLTQKYGMEGIGDMELEWLTPQETEQRWKDYREYVEKCKKDGTYGKEYDLVINMQHDPHLDSVSKVQLEKTAFSFGITDFNKF